MVRARANSFISSGKNLYLLFSSALAVLSLADAIMSYSAPLLIEKLTSGNDTMMGVVLASSSMIGICMDFLFAKLFPQKNSWFFLRLIFIFAFYFPLPFLLFHSIPAAVIGMLAWGIYFEAMVFANFHAIHETVPVAEHSWAWGTASVIRTLAWVAGPILASALYGYDPVLPVRFAIGTYALSLVLFGILGWVGVYRKKTGHVEVQKAPHSFGTEFAIWKTYGKTLWPLIGFTMLFFLIESAFFSIGPLFAEHLKELHPLGGFFVSIYSIPGLFVGFMITRLSAPYGKKRLAYASAVLAGISFLLLGFGSGIWFILSMTFIASIGLCIWYPAISAVFEDYVARAKGFGNDLIGLTAMAGSFSYILGPILNGFLSDRIGHQKVFAFWGAVSLVYALFLFIHVKRKVKLPQHAAERLVYGAPLS